jgi:predicted Zn-dependent peptidase
VTELDSGLAVWAYDLPGQYILACNLALELPLNAEPAGREGVATLAVRTLDEGTLAHPGLAYAAALEDVGAEFSGFQGLSTTQCLLDVPSTGLDDALALFAEAVANPAFEHDDVARIRANRLAEIEQQEARGSYVASTVLRETVLDARLRGARPTGGETDQVAAIKAADVAGFHRRCYTPRGATLIIAGDLGDLDVAGSAERAFAAWRPDATPVEPETPRPAPARRRLIHRAGAVQADIRLGWYGIDRGDPRWAGLQVATFIVGGGFNSRLNTRLREELGYTYGVALSPRPYRSAGLIDLATSTKTASAPALIAEALGILRRTEFTADEVSDAISHLIMSAPLTFDTADAVAAQAATLAAARLPLDHVTGHLRALAAVTPESAAEAYDSLITPDAASIVVVGDAAELAGLGFDQD